MSNYPNRPFFYNLFSAFRPYPTPKTATSGANVSTTTANSHAFTSPSTQSSSANGSTATSSTSSTSSTSQLVSQASTSSAHAQITQAATARAIASKSSSSGQTQGFAQAAAAFSPPSHHHTKHTGSGSPARRAPSTAYGPQGFGGRARRGSDSSGDEGFVQRPGADKWFVGGKMGNGEERFYKLSMVRRERSNDRKSCDRMSL